MIGAIHSEPNDESYKDYFLFLTKDEILALKNGKLEGKLIDIKSQKEHACSLVVNKKETGFELKNTKLNSKFIIAEHKYSELISNNVVGGRIGGFYKIDIIEKQSASTDKEFNGYLRLIERYLSTRNA
jgi:hypothetical protein